jgi:hypothetical protein
VTFSSSTADTAILFLACCTTEEGRVSQLLFLTYVHISRCYLCRNRNVKCLDNSLMLFLCLFSY